MKQKDQLNQEFQVRLAAVRAEASRKGEREQRQAEAATKIQAVLRGKVAKKTVAY